MPRYTVMVDDNFHYMDEGERYEHGTFETADEALAACRGLVERSLEEQYKPGMTSAQLFEAYIFFGEDPFIITVGGAAFSARDHARERVEAMCASGSS